MTIGARMYRLENQVSQVDRKVDSIAKMLKIVLHRQQEQASAFQTAIDAAVRQPPAPPALEHAEEEEDDDDGDEEAGT